MITIHPDKIPCRICLTLTRMPGTFLCDRCWELETRIKRDPEITCKILVALAAPGAVTPPIPSPAWPPNNLKILEIRDRGTFIPAWAFSCESARYNYEESYLLGRAGYRTTNLIMFGYLEGGREAHYDPHSWPVNPHTMPLAHQWITEHWDEIKSGDVIDVEFIMGWTTTKKASERHE